jgi:tRNA pseudouridine65 synthase
LPFAFCLLPFAFCLLPFAFAFLQPGTKEPHPLLPILDAVNGEDFGRAFCYPLVVHASPWNATQPGLVLLHRDDAIAAFAKPSGLLVHRGWADDDTVAVDLARAALGARVHPLHRLDRATSGVLLFALDPGAAAAMMHLFERGEVKKRYLALVRGVPPAAGVVDHPVPKGEGGPRVPAVTAYRTLATVGRWSLVEARPETGRLHQIRRHLKHLGHPIVGDVNYGKGDVNRFFREGYGLHRLALHAAEVRFRHPVHGEEVVVRAPVPEDLRGPLVVLGMPEEALC